MNMCREYALLLGLLITSQTGLNIDEFPSPHIEILYSISRISIELSSGFLYAGAASIGIPFAGHCIGQLTKHVPLSQSLELYRYTVSKLEPLKVNLDYINQCC
jgi:hypothetical protein